MSEIRTPGLRSCERVTVSRVVLLEGAGVEGDPCRLVTYLYDDDGTLLVRTDPTPAPRMQRRPGMPTYY